MILYNTNMIPYNTRQYYPLQYIKKERMRRNKKRKKEEENTHSTLLTLY